MGLVLNYQNPVPQGYALAGTRALRLLVPLQSFRVDSMLSSTIARKPAMMSAPRGSKLELTYDGGTAANSKHDTYLAHDPTARLKCCLLYGMLEAFDLWTTLWRTQVSIRISRNAC